jgi:uncharacterized protein YkwD
MLRATNATRAAHGLPRLRLDRIVAPLTQGHTRVMADEHRLFHTPDVGRYLNHVGRWHRWGENIGWTSGSIRDLERAFMASPDHRVHVLSRSFHHVAVGAVSSGGKIWVTLFFYG